MPSVLSARPGALARIKAHPFAHKAPPRGACGPGGQGYTPTPAPVTSTLMRPADSLDPQFPDVTEEELVASLCKDSFYFFVQEFWHIVVPEEPVWNWHIEYICNELQALAEDVIAGKPRKYDEIINICPGMSKSTVVSVLFCCWVWTKMPTARFICLSYSHGLSGDLSRKSRDCIRSEKYQKCFPEIQIREDQDTKVYFLLKTGGGRFSAGTDGTVVGFHAHFIIVDDPLNPKKSASEAERKQVNDMLRNDLSTRKIDKQITVTVMIMQRVHQDDPSGNWLADAKKGRRPLRHVCLPAEDSSNVQPPELRERYKAQGGLLDPVRLGSLAIKEEKGKGEYYYSTQFRQSPIPEGGGMFKTDLIQRIDVPPPRNEFRKLVRYWDKASTEKNAHQKGDYTVGTLMGLDQSGGFWVLDVIRVQLDPFMREALIKRTAYYDGVRVRVGIEQGPADAGKESAMASARRLAGFRVTLDRVTGSKEERADLFAYQMNAGNVYCVNRPWTDEWIEELSYFPYGKHDDQVDSVSGAFAMLAKPRGRIGAMDV
jgi:predicted phage terminase large subunit-like protein